MKTVLLFFSFLLFLNLVAASSQELYWQAKNSADNCVKLFEKAFQKEPKSLYAQKSLLELGKLELLNRNYKNALGYLKKVTNPNLQDKEFWLAKIYFKLENHNNAIISAQNFIADAKDNSINF